MDVLRRIKRFAAANLLDAPRYSRALHPRNPSGWLNLCNRGQALAGSPDQRGVRILNDPWCSCLFYCQAYPQAGLKLMRAAMAEWPIVFGESPAVSTTERPQVTFIIGHRGQARLPHLLTTLRSIAAQRDVVSECLVVEQSATQELLGALPTWVRYLHTPPPYSDMPFSRSWAFNRGALEARGDYLVFHDNDICVPESYAREVVNVLGTDFEAARFQRFVFYLSEKHTNQLFTSPTVALTNPPLEIVQNGEGQTIAIRRDSYFSIGGHDEAFLGWGGEDNEMFDRLRIRKLHDCSYLPFLHLYHAPQPGKGAINPNTTYFQERMRIPASARVEELLARGFGRTDSPTLLPRSERLLTS